MREAFEAWVLVQCEKYKYHFREYVLTKYENGDYCTAWVDAAWMSWKACWEYRDEN